MTDVFFALACTCVGVFAGAYLVAGLWALRDFFKEGHK